MKILVDADACPVKEIVVKESKKNGLPVYMFIDTSHELSDGYSEVIMVDKARNSADFALIARAKAGDIVVTQDFGVAAMALAVGAYALNQNGLVFTSGNISSLLEQRHISQKIRRSGGRTSNPPRRNKTDNQKFETAFVNLITDALKRNDKK